MLRALYTFAIRDGEFEARPREYMELISLQASNLCGRVFQLRF